MRAGFVALVGAPNAGKSTLLNALVGQKLAIVSPRPQTTRTRVTGIRNLPEAQLVFVDTPGFCTGEDQLGAYMAGTVERTLAEVDVVCLVVDAAGRGAAAAACSLPLTRCQAPVVCVLNKMDRVRPRERLLPLIDAWRAAPPCREVVPVSALRGTNCDRVLDVVAGHLPEHPPLFPLDTATDQPETFWVAEVVREKVFRLTHAEVPYAVAVAVDELGERRAPERLEIRATLFAERESQKGILVGCGGAMLKAIGIAARRELEAFFGVPVFLGLTVAVRRDWRRDPRALRDFGFRLTS